MSSIAESSAPVVAPAPSTSPSVPHSASPFPAKVGITFSADKAVSGRRIFKGGIFISYLPLGYDTEADVKRLVESDLALGAVSGIKITNKVSDRGAQILSAYVDILYWFNTYSALSVQTQLVSVMRNNGTVSISDSFVYNGATGIPEPTVYELFDETTGASKGFEFLGQPSGKFDFRFKNGKPMTHLTLRPIKIGITCDGSILPISEGKEAASWSSLYIPILPKNMVDFATSESEGDVDKRNTILDDILYAMFENYQCVGQVSRIDYSDIEAPTSSTGDKDEEGGTHKALEEGEIRVTGLRAFVHFHEWWNTVNSLVIRNSVEATSKQWQIRGHVDQYNNEYGYIVVKKNEKPISLTEKKVRTVSESSDSETAKKLSDLEKENAELRAQLARIVV